MHEEKCNRDGEDVSFRQLICCSPTVHRSAGSASKKRKVAHSEIITSSPYKRSLVSTGPSPRVANKAGKKPKPQKNKRVRVKNPVVKESRLQTACYKCGILVGDPSDNKRDDDWIQCQPCGEWFHESCGEAFGILDDDTFTCQGCF